MGKFKELMIEAEDALIAATKEALDLEPLADEDGVPAFNDYDGMKEVARNYDLDEDAFLDHILYVSSHGMAGEKYAA